MAPIKGRKSANKNVPVLSHEFVIQNHADIVSCVAMVIVIGLMVQFTSPLAYLFVALQYGESIEENKAILTYGTGLKDLLATFFYFLICIIFHAIIQEYVLDKVSRKLHLSKSKNSKFYESGQLIVFNAVSMVWALDILVKENWLANLSLLWNGYPHNTLSFSTKFFYIIQFAYWAHILPELYFQKIKKEEMFNKIKYSILYMAFVSTIYVTNFNRVGVVVLLLHYISGVVYHAVQLIDITEKEEDSKKVKFAQSVYNWIFLAVQVLIFIVSQVTLWFGLASVEYSGEQRDFNTPLLRLLASASALAVQIWIVYEFFNVNGNLSISFGLGKQKSKVKTNDDASKKRKKAANKKFNELTEADQNIKKTAKAELNKAIKSKKL
ncbi:translocating chain-associated membrane protein 1 [Daktulosphaira vitifoliae]|uniref:translocating chain-associated membrane protein 1 n=1 Tax=Daktulosphaira vitifoliae TaxID=58002 RepID=UPI0021AAC433|nr:translocating chain-associated membrane protein 1 [Daktulosphaira vitifoliae]